MSTRRLLSLIPMAACSAVTLSLAAQSTGVTTGDVKGVVLSQNKLVQQGKVTLVQDSTNATRALNIDATGTFAFRLLAPGVYTLKVEAPGYSTKEMKGITVRLGATAEIPVEVDAVEATATVVVESTAALADPTRTQVASTIDNNYITNLPINRRDFTAFSLTTPMVAVDRSPAGQGGAAASSGLSFAGQNARQNNIMVDGLDNNDVSVGSTRTTFSQDAIQEFVVVANGFSAEYGRAAGGTLNIVTKSGGNDFAGSTFYFRRSGRFDAKDPLAPEVTSFRQIQEGATVSGPIIKDKLFYFISVEHFDKRAQNTVAIDPAVVSAAQSVMGFTISDGNQPYEEFYTTALVKLDWNQTDNSRWSLRYSQANETNGSQLPFGGQTDESAGGSRVIKDKSWSLSNTWNATNSFVNDFRLLGSIRDHTLLSLDDTQTASINLAGFGTWGTQRFTPQLRTEKNSELVDTASFFTATNSLKVGVDYLRTQLSGSLPLQFGGVYRFQGFDAGDPNALAAFTAPNPYGGQGRPAAFIQGFGADSLDFTTSYTSLFLQDDWQITSNFTLKLGVRYDRENLPAFKDVPDYDALMAGGASQLSSFSIYALPGSSGATVNPGGPYNSADLFRVGHDWSSSRFSPRLSFNWQATPVTRVYGGYGTFSGRTQLGPYGAVFLNNGTDMMTLVQILGADPNDPLAPWRTWANAAGNSNHRYTSFPAGGTKSILLPGDSEMPETRQANLGVEFLPMPTLKLSIDAIYSRGYHFLNVRDVNALIPNPAYNPALPVSNSNEPTRRPDTRYSSVIRYDGSGESKYRAVSFTTAWQFKDTAALNFSYTWSKSEDNYIDWVTDYEPQNPFDANANWGPSNQDQRHRFLLSAVFSTKNFSNILVKDWTISAIGRFTSGRPYTILTGVDNDYGVVAGIPRGNGDGGAAPADQPVGTTRNSETTPFTSNVDLRLDRTLTFSKRYKLELMVDVFNVFNHYSASQIQNVLAAPGYGDPIVNNAVDFNRQIQGGIRFSF